ncbi:PP2C family protein-serine/threonine phosphatase [Devosia sp. CN2-171]|uniref:PP2C family protein-serine/threonine phosphatase n=1 Tax=Devosia sp. CN2-171 TaxID=3400909 RepID=UPI003BF82331
MAQSLGGRSVQEDCAGFAFDPGGQYGYAIVADGLGGHEAGDLASAAAVAAAAALWDEDKAHPMVIDPRRFVEEAVAEGQRRVLALNAERGIDAKTTVCCVFVSREQVVVANVGDSRVYRVVGRNLERLSRDHSVVEMLVVQGEISADAARGHPDSSLLTQSLGGPEVPRPHIAEIDARPGERIILCSDGLWQALPASRIARLSRSSPDPAAQLAQAGAFAAGTSGDNITAIVVAAAGAGLVGWLRQIGIGK